MKTTIRWVDDIGMFAMDRSIPQSCVHRTEHCATTCYNLKLYKVYPAMHGRDEKNEEFWRLMTGDIIYNALKAKRKPVDRFRMMTRGEAFKTLDDIYKVVDVLVKNPDTLFWVPTRAWRNRIMRSLLNEQVAWRKNIRLIASMDPSNTPDEWEAVRELGWSTMFYGNDTLDATPTGEPFFKCPKTWDKKKAACATCVGGCFEDVQVNVHLKRH